MRRKTWNSHKIPNFSKNSGSARAGKEKDRKNCAGTCRSGRPSFLRKREVGSCPATQDHVVLELPIREKGVCGFQRPKIHVAQEEDRLSAVFCLWCICRLQGDFAGRWAACSFKRRFGQKRPVKSIRGEKDRFGILFGTGMPREPAGSFFDPPGRAEADRCAEK